MNKINVTVALFTCHRAWMLGEALRSLDRMVSDEQFTFEILVVDNASQESTRRFVTEFAATASQPVRLVCEEKPGLSCARNRAISEARGDWIAFFDDDQLAEPEWLREMFRLADEKQCRLVGGTLRLKLPDGCSRNFGPVCRKILGEALGGPAPRRYSRTFTPGFGHVLVHKSVFDEVGVFDEQLIAGGEDFDVYNRIRAANIAGWYAPTAVAYHVIPQYRIADPYMRWTSLRHGGHVARRERNIRGGGTYAAFAVARLGQATLVHAPRFIWQRLRRDRELALDARCRLWRNEGYLRQALHDALPAVFPQREFFASLNFREGRQRLAESEQGAGSQEQGVRSDEQRATSDEQGARTDSVSLVSEHPVLPNTESALNSVLPAPRSSLLAPSSTPDVSILMTVYNGMPYLPDAVDSMLRQSLSEFSFIIVNDGSTDETAGYLNGLSDPRITVVHQENLGTAAAANHGLKFCDSEFVARIDADDISLPTRLEHQRDFLITYPEVGLVGTQMAPLGAAGPGRSLHIPLDHEEIMAALMSGRHGMGHSCIMMRTALLKQIGGYWPYRLNDAWDMMLRMGEMSRLANINSVLHHYRVHEGSLNGSAMRRMRFSIAFACELARRRQAGRPAISPDEFQKLRNARPWWNRAREVAEVHALCQYRLATAERLGHSPLRGALRMSWAAACAPGLTALRFGRLLRFSRTHSTHTGQTSTNGQPG